MDSILDRCNERLINYLLFAFFLICSVKSTYALVTPYTLGEWLINYEGGFVRRGLPGEIILSIAAVADVAPQLLLENFVLAIFLINMAIVGALIHRLSWQQTFWLLFGPAFLLLVPLDFVSRKDGIFYGLILLHSLLCVTGYGLLRFQKFVLPVLGILTMLSHELYAFLLPYHLLLIHLSCSDPRERGRLMLINLIPLLPLGMVLFNSGDIEQRRLMCERLAGFSVACDGGILSIGSPLEESVRLSLRVLRSGSYSLQSYWLVYAASNLMSLYLFKSALLERLDGRRLKLFAFANLLFPVMFVLGWDIGRWITLFSLHNFAVLTVLQGRYVRNEKVHGFNYYLLTGFAIVSLSLFLDNRGCCGYSRDEHPVTASKLPMFWANGVDLLLTRTPR